MTPWLNVVGIGDDGVAALSPAARALVDTAEVLVGGERHLALVDDKGARRLAWRKPLAASFRDIDACKGQRVTVLASGDPTWFGVGSALAREFGPHAVHIVPAPGAFSLACARLGWARQDVVCLSLHGGGAGRQAAGLRLHLGGGAKILALAEDGGTPAAVAAVLVADGYGDSTVTVLEHLGGAREARHDLAARAVGTRRFADLNTIAIDCGDVAGVAWPRVAGLADDAFVHDGQLTKQVVRAATVAALAPKGGERLWDLGAGNGSVAIEWLRALGGRGAAVAVERDAGRCATIAVNGSRLGVPDLEVVQAVLPEGLEELEVPDAVFVGGGLTTPGLFELCRGRLAAGGRLVANAVTVEGEAVLAAQYQAHKGTLRRIAVNEAVPVGGRTGWRPAMPVTQWTWHK